MDEYSESAEAQWAAQFAVTPAQIRAAVAAVGPKKADVEMYLKGSHSSSDADVTKQGGD